MSRYKTPEEYDALVGKDRVGWHPEWERYKTKKVRSYSDCYECGHREFLGWVEETKGVGEPYRYKYIKPSILEWVWYDMGESMAQAYDMMWNARLNPSTGGETITIPHLTPKRASNGEE